LPVRQAVRRLRLRTARAKAADPAIIGIISVAIGVW
jgi:hypothetical protein